MDRNEVIEEMMNKYPFEVFVGKYRKDIKKAIPKIVDQIIKERTEEIISEVANILDKEAISTFSKLGIIFAIEDKLKKS